MEIAILANGCFWCTEAVFQRLKGVHSVVSGYTGGHIKNPAYREVCRGITGHAEGIKIEFDPAVITYQQLLEVFFMTHDPTTLNRQGHDVGTQYRSEIFYTNAEQKRVAELVIAALEAHQVFGQPIVTAISEASEFYEAESDHWDYYNRNPEQPYCQILIDPKVKKIKELFTDLVRTEE